MKHIRQSEGADTSSVALKIGTLKKRQQYLRRHQMIRVWISCLAILFLFMHQIVSINTSPLTKLDSSKSDLLYGGFTSKEDFLLTLDSAEPPYPTSLLKTFKITDADLQNTTLQSSWNPSHKALVSGPLVIWSLSPNYQPPYLGQSTILEPKFALAETQGSKNIIYGTPLPVRSSSAVYNTAALAGVTSQGQEFFILKSSGNIVTTWDVAQESSFCYKSPDHALSYLSCPNSPSFTTTIKVENATYKTDATYLKARAGDHLRYTLSTQSNTSTEYTPALRIDDILEYADIEDYPGAYFNSQTQSLIWKKQQLLPNQQQTVSFGVKIKDRIPLEHQNNNNGRSYDCRLSVYFGVMNSVDIVCPPQKVIERLVTGPSQTQFVLVMAWFILIVNSLLLLYNNRLLRHVQMTILSLRRRITP